jgi:regulator of RNase E activity RraA
MAALGFRLIANVPRPDPALVEGFRGAATGHVGDALGRSAAMAASIKPVSPVVSFCGVAFTVKTRPVDNLVVWKALQLAQPGDVLVIATGQHLAHSNWGDLTSRVGAGRGLAMVTDGAVRDLDGIAEAGLPVFAAAVTPNSPQKDGPGEINVPIACGGQVVHPGDILVGDRDGVVVVPRHDAAAALSELERIRSYETQQLEAIARGDFFHPGSIGCWSSAGRCSSMRPAMPNDRHRSARRRIRRAYPTRLLERDSGRRRDRRVEPQRGTRTSARRRVRRAELR